MKTLFNTTIYKNHASIKKHLLQIQRYDLILVINIYTIFHAFAIGPNYILKTE